MSDSEKTAALAALKTNISLNMGKGGAACL